jgi:26S proteasome regulatory subunit T5
MLMRRCASCDRQTVFLPMIGLVPADKLKPGDLIGVNKDSYLVLDTLPAGEA